MRTRRKKAPPKRALTIDIRDKRLPDGRLTISSRTADSVEYTLRRAAVVALLNEGSAGLEVIQRLRDRRLRIDVVSEKVHTRQINALLEEVRKLSAPAAAPQMLGVTIDRFLSRVEAKQADGTLVQYRGFCEGMEKSFGVVRDVRGKVVQDVPMHEILTEAAEAWLHGTKQTTGRAWSANRQTVAHNVAHQVWALAISADEERSEVEGAPRTITRNIFSAGKSKVTPPKIRKTRVVFLSRVQAGRLLKGSRGKPIAALIALGIYAGLRAGEAVNLRVGTDLRLDKGQIVIQARDGAYPWRPKTDNSVREVPINRVLARWLRAHIRDGFAGKVYLIHPAGKDRPISAKTRERWVVEAFGQAGIEYGRDKGNGATLHTLRHTFASWLAQQDVQLLKIAALMGDTNQTVEKTYAHLLPKDLEATVARLTSKSR